MQNPRDCQSAFGNVYNTVASASKNFWAFAGSSASLSAFALAFAGVPQVLRRTCWPLQHAINDILNKGISFFLSNSRCTTPISSHIGLIRT